MSRNPDSRFLALTRHGTEDERRVDAGDGIPAFGPHCAFRCTFCYSNEHGCAYEVRGTRDHDGVQVPACALHLSRDGFLHDDARAAYVAVLAARLAGKRNQFKPIATALAVVKALRSAGVDARVIVASGPNPGRVEFGTPRSEVFPLRLTLDPDGGGGVVVDVAGDCAGACDGELADLVDMCTEVAQQLENECTCEFGDTIPDPLCRQHGVEDVVSGAYDRNPAVRKAVDSELARVNR